MGSTRISCPQCGTQFQGEDTDALKKLLDQHVSENHDSLVMKHAKVLRDAQAMAVAIGNGARVDRGAARELANRISTLLTEPIVFPPIGEPTEIPPIAEQLPTEKPPHAEQLPHEPHRGKLHEELPHDPHESHAEEEHGEPAEEKKPRKK